MLKKNNRIAHRTGQRQKQRRRAILIIAASGIGCLVIALVIFINTSRIDQSMASITTYMVTEDDPVTDFTLEAPVLKQRPAPGPNTLMVKAVKYDSISGAEDNH